MANNTDDKVPFLEDYSKPVERGGTYCDFCDELISRHRLTNFDLMKKGGTVVQLLEPGKYESMMMGGMGTAQTVTSLEDGIACSKGCAERLLRRFVRRRPEEQGRAFVALSGQELKRLGAAIDPKAYVASAWDGSKEKLLLNASAMAGGGIVPTTFDSYASALEAPQEAGQLGDGSTKASDAEVMKKETLTSIEALLSKGKSAKFLK